MTDETGTLFLEPSDTANDDRDPRDRPILLFDGACNLCHSLVQFVLERDSNGEFRFAALQSEAGQRLLEEFDLPRDDFDTLVMVDGERHYTRSSAGLRVLRRLGLPWSAWYLAAVVPRPIRDWVYDRIAARRYGWFGTREVCPVPDEAPIPRDDLEDRFLE